MRLWKINRFLSRFHLAIILVFLFLLDGLALLVIVKLDYDSTCERARIVLQKTAISLEERIKRTVIATEAILQSRALRIQEIGLKETISSREEWQRFRRAAEMLPDAGSLWLLDAEGNLLLDSTVYPSRQANFKEREYVAAHRDEGIETFIGPVVKGKITKKYSFTVTHRISDTAGNFLGIVVAAIETDDFTNFLRQIDVGENGAAVVVRTDGALVLRQPMDDRYLGRNYSHLTVFRLPHGQMSSGIIETDGIDGARRLMAYSKVDGFPMIAATTIPVDSLTKEWGSRARGYALLAAVIFVALTGFSWLVRRTTVKEEEERREELSTVNRSLQGEIAEKVEAQLALRASEQRWITTLASIGDGVIATDVSGRVTFMNAVAQDLTYWTFEEAEGRPVREIFRTIDEGTGNEVENAVERVLQAGATVGPRNHAVVVRRDGSSLPIDDSGAPIRDKAGATIGVVLVFRDITHRRQAEERIRHIASFPELNPNPVLEVDQSGVISYANPAARRIVGEGDEGLSGVRLFVPSDLPSIEAAWDKVTESVLYREVEVKKNIFGETIFFSPQLSTVRIYAYDITKLKHTEKLIEESNKRLRILSTVASQLLAADEPRTLIERLCTTVMEYLDCHMFFNYLVDDDHRRLYLNACAGLSPEMAEDIEWLEFGTAVCGSVARDGSRIVAENILSSADEKTELVRSFGIAAYACHPLFSGGKVIGTLSFGTRSRLAFSDDELDVMKTVADYVALSLERKKAMTDLRSARDELEMRVNERTAELSEAYRDLQAEMNERKRAEEQLFQAHKMEAIGTLAGGIAHDFNNIIAGILGFTEMVIDDLEPGTVLHRRLSNVLRGAYRGRDLVKQILTFSRRGSPERKNLSVRALVDEAISLIRATLPSTIEIRTKMNGRSDIISADATQIHQVLVNLCVNASHAMADHGGTLEILLDDRFLDEKECLAYPGLQPGPHVMIGVRDTGCGMTADVLERIFEPFFTTKPQGEGTGLGLSVIHGIVRAHDGAIRAYSEPGRGSLFEVLLPNIPTSSFRESDVLDQFPGGKEHVLVVDDEPGLVQMEVQRLERLGYRVTGKTDSVDAVRTFASDPGAFDVLIADFLMPGLTGLDLVKEVRNIRPHLPVILCSGVSDGVLEKKMKERDIQYFLRKPATIGDLALLLRRVLDQNKGGI